jgi:hypothetical protein
VPAGRRGPADAASLCLQLVQVPAELALIARERGRPWLQAADCRAFARRSMKYAARGVRAVAEVAGQLFGAVLSVRATTHSRDGP